MSLKSELTHFLDVFGFESINDFNNSLWHINKEVVIKLSIKLGMILSILSVPVEQCFGFQLFLLEKASELIGMPPIMFLAFMVLVVLEGITGITASLKSGDKFKSRSFSRIIIKGLVYSILMFILNSFTIGTKAPEALGMELDPWLFLYHAVGFGIMFQMLVSVLENLARLGYVDEKRVPIITPLLQKYRKWFDFEPKNKEE